MTPKEALKGIKQAIAEHLHKQTGENVEKHFKYVTEIDIVDKALNELEELKSYPTAEEVCEALSDYLEKKVKYVGHSFMLLDGFEVVDTNLDDIDGNYLPRINLQIPPYLIIMIGKFYESLEEK